MTDDARTLIDRADRCSFRELRIVADRLRRLPVVPLETKQARLPGRAGHARIRRLVTAQDARARFPLERRLTAYLDHHGLPQPDARNEVVVVGLETDAVYRVPRLALELDSRAHHQRRAEMAEDKGRDRRYRRNGWTPIRQTWEELDPAENDVAEELAELLGPPDRPGRATGLHTLFTSRRPIGNRLGRSARQPRRRHRIKET